MNKKKNTRKARLIYVGVYVGTENKKYHKYYEIKDEKVDTQEVSVYDSKLYPCSIGGCFSIDVHDRGCMPSTTKWIEHWQDSELVSKWRVKSEAIELDFAQEKKLKAEKAENPLAEKLKPVREAYQELNWRQKRAMMANIIQYITG